jgi:DNA-directed RNA polymerase specialized sigma24 family protein
MIAEALPELTDAHRRSLLCDLAGEDYRSIAAREGITVSSARIRFHHATQKLQQVIKNHRATPATPA